MKTIRLVLGDQLSRNLSSLRDIDAGRDVVLMVEAEAEATSVRHHRQKIVLVFSAMRHFARALAAAGLDVDYVRLDDESNTGTIGGEIERAVSRHRADRVVVTEPGEWRLLSGARRWAGRFGVPVDIREDDRFLCPSPFFASWAADRPRPRMEHFYHEMRRRTGWLMEDGAPRGGRWNYDAENRKPPADDLEAPRPARSRPDEVTRQVVALVAERFPSHFGDLDAFDWAVTRRGALAAFRRFLRERLPFFGDFQDAMKRGEDILFHAAISPCLNIGLLSPREVCEGAIAELDAGRAPLAAVEGFVRQILGWREYVRGVYRLRMPGYAKTNFLGAHRPLPAFYWTGKTEMRCLRDCIEATRRNAYAHHIQRLMVTGNFALLAGIEPSLVEEWYLIVYADAWEWVELPNTHGMALFADGGVLGSKPYAASGAYIDRMSDYCRDCPFDPGVKLGPGACPFNVLYWGFLIANRSKLGKNPRMALVYRTLDRMTGERRRRIVDEARRFLGALDHDGRHR